jgi:hypothetical protein
MAIKKYSNGEVIPENDPEPEPKLAAKNWTDADREALTEECADDEYPRG